jgi:hypothetical protein
MGYWEVITPEASQNLIDNPSFELGTTGWTPGGNTFVRSSDQSLFGHYSGKLTYVTSADLVQYNVTLTNDQYTYTAYVYIPSDWDGGAIRLDAHNFTGRTVQEATTTTTTTGQWVRLRMRFTPASGDLQGNLMIEAASAPSAGKFIYIEAVQIEKQDHETTYIDGDQPGCTWDGAKHASPSSRTAVTTEGGRVYELEDLGFTVESQHGAGMPNVRHLSTRRIMMDGEEYQRAQVDPRIFRLRSTLSGSTMANFHAARRTFLESIRPDDQHQAYIFRYNGAGGLARELRARYDRGLEMTGPRGFSEIALWVQFIAHDPYWYRLGEASQELDNRATLTSYGLISRIDGLWSGCGVTSGATTGTDVFCMAIDKKNGILYIGGDFTGWNGISGADYIAQYDIEAGTWSKVGGSSDINNNVQALLVAPNGDLYVGGQFTNAGGVGAADLLAMWDGSWNAVGTPGITTTGVYALAMAGNGDLYIGGYFDDWASIANADDIVMWDGSSYSALGTGSSSGVLGLAFDLAGNLYAVGGFSDMGGVGAADRIAKWNGSSWSALHSTPMTTIIDDIVLAPNGDLIICGGNQTWNGVTLNSICRWNGQTFLPLGDGVTGTGSPNEGVFDTDGSLWVAGSFVDIGNIDELDKVARWDGSAWGPTEIEPASGVQFEGLALLDGDLYLGHDDDTTGETIVYGQATTVTNNGSAKAWPVLTIKRTGSGTAKIRAITNETTGRQVAFHYDLLEDETLTIDLRPGQRGCSSDARGDAWIILPGSDVTEFYLRPGDNSLVVLVSTTGSPTITAFVKWRDTDWSTD